MPTNFPSSLDDNTSLPTKSAGQTITSAETNTQSGALKAIEAKLGIGSSTPVKAYELGSTATGSSDWRERAVIDARDYGAYPDSGSDEAGHIQSAIDACAALGGGKVLLLPGTYLTSVSLTITTSSVILEGAGLTATILERTGADTGAMVYIQTPDMTTTKIKGSGVRRMKIDGSATATYGVRITTVNLFDLQQLWVIDCSTQIYMDCWDDRNGGDARDNQGGAARDIFLTCTGSQVGIKIHGNSDAAIGAGDGANTSLCYFENFLITIVNGNAFIMGNSDGNQLNHLRVYRTGSGVGLVFGASALASGGHARYNQCYNIQTADAGVTANSNTTPSGPNFVMMSANNGGNLSTVTISGSAVLYVSNDEGYISATRIKFPATQVPSSDANVLDDYEEGTWTPALQYATAGSSSWSTSGAGGYYTKIGDRVMINGVITTVPTNGTGAGALQMTGFPFTHATANSGSGFNCQIQGYTKANFTQVSANLGSGLIIANFQAGGSGQNLTALAVGDIPSGGTVVVRITGPYYTG